MGYRNKTSIRAHGVTGLLASHPEIRKLKRIHVPAWHGNKLWHSSWLLMDFFRRRGLPEGARVMDIGCGWGLAGIYCAKRHAAVVTAVDIDKEVFSFLELHAAINGVKISTMKRAFGGLTQEQLTGHDVLIGADVCFWDKLVLPLKKLINRALRAGIRLVLIADPGRSTFHELGDYFIERGMGQILDWRTRRPRCIQGQILAIRADAKELISRKAFGPTSQR